MYIYAIIDSTNTCVGVSYLCGEVVQDNMIRIDSAVAETVMWRKYESGEWVQQEIPAPVIQRQEVIAKDAEFCDGTDIVVTLNDGDVLNNGTLLKFLAPCDCAAFKGILRIGYDEYCIVDAAGRDYAIIEHGSIWAAGAKLSVLIDHSNRLAYLQNAAETVNSIVENISDSFVDSTHEAVQIDNRNVVVKHSHGLGISFFRMDFLSHGIAPQDTATINFTNCKTPNGCYKCWSSHDLLLHCEVLPTESGFDIAVSNVGGSTVTGVVSVFGWFFA